MNPHVLVAMDGNGRGMFRAVCRCGHAEYARSANLAREKLAAHISGSVS